MLHYRQTLAFKPLISRLTILYFLPLLPHHRPLLLAVLLRLLPPLPLTLSGFPNGMLEVSEPGALNYFTFSRPIPLILSASRNPISTHLPLSGFLDSLLCVLIALTSGLAFSLVIPPTPAAASSFSSGWAYPFLNFLPPLFLRLIPTLIMYGSTSLLTTPPRCLFLMCPPPPPVCSSPTDGRTNSFFPSSRNLFILGDFNCDHPLWDSGGTSDPRGEEVFDWIISFDLLPLNDPDTPTLLHRSSPDISFAPSSLAHGRCFRTWVLTTYQFFYQIHLFLSQVFCPIERPPFLNFQKARWDGFASHCPFAEEYSSLSSAAALFTSLALNAVKSSIPFSRIKRPLNPDGLLRWKVRLVKDTRLLLPLTEVMKISRLTSPLLDVPR